LNSLNAQPAVRDYDGRPMTASTPVNAAAHALLNDPAELAEITRTLAPRDDGARRLETVLTVDGVHCAACVVSIEAALRDAVESVSVNAATRRARLVFLPDSQPLSSLFERIERLGYRPRPVSREAIGMAEHAGRRVALWRMLVASLCMMQIMMYAVPRYTAAALEMPPDIVRLLTWAEWTLSLPVLRYGPYSVAGESVWDHPFQWGSKRTGGHCGESARGSGRFKSAPATRSGSDTEPADTRRSPRRRGACRNGCNRTGGAGTRPAPPFLRLTELRPEPAARPPPAVRGLREIPGKRHRRSRCS